MTVPVLTRLDDVVRCGLPDRPAVTYRDKTLTYGELSRRVASVAAGLRAGGLVRGDRVVVFLDKRIETVVVVLAISAAGGVLVPVNPVFKPAQVGHVLLDCAARFLVTSPERLQALRANLDDAILHRVVLVGEPTEAPPQHGGRILVSRWDELTAEPSEDHELSDGVVDTDVAAILYTSGSTGRPKGVVLSHRNLLAGAVSVASYLEHTEADVILAVLPLSFDAGFSQLTTSLTAGAHVVLVNYLRPREVVKLMAQHRVTGITCVPPLWLQLEAVEWPVEATRGLRYFANTGGHMPRATLTRLRELFPAAKPFLMYGLTEAFRSTYLDPAEVDRRPGSIGKAIPNADVRVVRRDGSLTDPGERGEIVHRGALVALGYWNDPVGTAQRFRPLPTPCVGVAQPELAVWSGDVAYRDEAGFLYLVGRRDDMIKTSGYRVSPSEIEEVAYATGLVAEAVALGVPDERLGQVVVLAVTALAGDKDCDTGTLHKALTADLPGYMVPRRIEVVPGLPRSGNGKFDRAELRRLIS